MNTFSDLLGVIGNISWKADIAALIVATAIGFVWYSPIVFGNAWTRLVGLQKNALETHKIRNLLFWYTPITLVIAANIAAFCKHLHYYSAVKGMLVGYDIGLLVCLYMAMQYFYEKRSLSLYGINAGYIIISTSAMGLVIGIILT